MNSSNQHQKLPAWIFIATDLALIGAALTIALLSSRPLSGTAISWIVSCVGTGVLVGLVPLIVYYERQKNEMLDERQRALEALARTVSSSAEQISIAANGLHEIAELALKNLRMAEHLPHKLQDKIAEFQAQMAAANDADKEELERELLALRTTESERLEAVALRIAKSTAEWTKLEAATHQHLTAANEGLTQLAGGTASAISHAQTAAEKALSQAQSAATHALEEASHKVTRAAESARASAVTDFDGKLAAATALIVDRVVQELSHRLTATGALAHAPHATHVLASAPAVPPIVSDADISTATTTAPAPTEETPAPVIRRPRKPRREEPAPGVADSAASVSVPSTGEVASAPHAGTHIVAPHDEPLPVPVAEIPEVTPVAPSTAEPFSGSIVGVPKAAPTVRPPESATPVAAADSEAEAPKTPRKKLARKAEDNEPGLGLELDEAGGNGTSRAGDRGLSSDGATRLVVTAYIGIGNRLFIRGDGPGLTWEKGVPLQFVSIGKWRWETNEAGGPVKFKLYKNDELECAALGAQSLDPGHQQEVTAAF